MKLVIELSDDDVQLVNNGKSSENFNLLIKILEANGFKAESTRIFYSNKLDKFLIIEVKSIEHGNNILEQLYKSNIILSGYIKPIDELPKS